MSDESGFVGVHHVNSNLGSAQREKIEDKQEEYP
jgi:hypothetical protein